MELESEILIREQAVHFDPHPYFHTKKNAILEFCPSHWERQWRLLGQAQTQGGMHLLTHLAVAQLSFPEIDNLISFT